MQIGKLIPILEQVKDMLAVKQEGPGTQKKASQSNKMSTAAAKAKLSALTAKSKKGRTSATTVQATGSKK